MVMNGKCHQEKPDTDNLIKAFLDALLMDDSRVWHISAKKYWGSNGAIVVLRNEVKMGNFRIDEHNFDDSYYVSSAS